MLAALEKVVNIIEFNVLPLIDCYLDYPDFTVADAASVLTSYNFRTNTRLLLIQTKAIPVKAANTMIIVERYH